VNTLLLVLAIASSQDAPLKKIDEPAPLKKVEEKAKAVQIVGMTMVTKSSVKTAYTTTYPAPRRALSVLGGVVAPSGRDATVVSSTQYGSGTVVKKEPNKYWVLACAHTVTPSEAGTNTLLVTSTDGKKLPGKVVSKDALRDLSLLEVTGEADVVVAPIAAVGDEDYKPGKATYKCGYPFGANMVIRRGHLSDVVNSNRDDPSIISALSSSGAVSGDSGGGLFREKKMALIGVVWGGKKEDGMLRATRLREIHHFLKAAKFASN
jgi:S1-C subfamily serine protease